MHIIGTTREGKSKLLEWLIRRDIRNGSGLMFLDPSDNGESMYKVLRYCAKIGHSKVLVIDPLHHELYNKIVPINPFSTHKEASVSNILDTFRVLFNVKDAAETARIQRYLTAILSVLWNAGLTLHETIYFTDPSYVAERMRILSESPEDDRHRRALEEVFKTRSMYLNEIQSTVRRLEPLFHPTLDLMFGSLEGLDLPTLIENNWVILVNVHHRHGFQPIHTKLIATALINELISGIDRLKLKYERQGREWGGRYYLYIDEAGRYANRNLADLLTYKAKSGLRLVLAHQYMGQFEDPYISEAVSQLCKIKVAFYQPDHQERLETVKAMFGGELKDRDVSYSLADIRKRHCVFKKPKQAPMIVEVPDLPDISFDVKPYLEKLYNDKMYLSPEEILEGQKARVKPEVHYATKPTPRNTKPSRKRKDAVSKTDSDTNVQPRIKTAFDD